MRVGVDIKAFKNGTTGIARYLRSILDELQMLDKKNDYVLFSCADSGYEISNPRWKKITTPWPFPGIFWLQGVLPLLLKKHAIDVLWEPEQVCPLCRTGRTSIVTTVYDLAFLRFPETCQWSNRLIQTLLFPRTVSRSAFLLPISDFIGTEIVRTYPSIVRKDAITPVYCSGPEWQVPAGYSPEKRGDFLFFPGNLEPRKNLVRCIAALELLKHRYGITIPLHLAGPSGWKNKTLFSTIENSPVKNAVRCLGYISEEELRRQYLSCKALIYPSLYEGFGMPVLEALSLDCLVLTSHGTVMQEIAGDAALYFDPESVESIAARIRQIYDPAFDRTPVLQKSRSVVSKYSWEKSARTMLGLFGNLFR